MNYEEWQKQLKYYDDSIIELQNTIKYLKNTINILYQIISANEYEKRKLITKSFDIKTGEEIEEKQNDNRV